MEFARGSTSPSRAKRPASQRSLAGRRPRPPVNVTRRQSIYSKVPRNIAFPSRQGAEPHRTTPSLSKPVGDSEERAKTPMGRSPSRWTKPRKIEKQQVPKVETVGQTISAASALSNGTEQVSLYLRALWTQSSSRSNAPLGQPIRPAYNSGLTNCDGMLTLQDHQRVLAHCLRDYTSRLGLAYRQSMLKRGSVAEFKNSELSARIARLEDKLKTSMEQLNQAHTRIARLEKERDAMMNERDSALSRLSTTTRSLAALRREAASSSNNKETPGQQNDSCGKIIS